MTLPVHSQTMSPDNLGQLRDELIHKKVGLPMVSLTPAGHSLHLGDLP